MTSLRVVKDSFVFIFSTITLSFVPSQFLTQSDSQIREVDVTIRVIEEARETKRTHVKQSACPTDDSAVYLL